MIVMIEGSSFEEVLKEAEKAKRSFCEVVDKMYELYEQSERDDDDKVEYRMSRDTYNFHEPKESRMNMRKSMGSRYSYRYA